MFSDVGSNLGLRRKTVLHRWAGNKSRKVAGMSMFLDPRSQQHTETISASSHKSQNFVEEKVASALGILDGAWGAPLLSASRFSKRDTSWRPNRGG